MSDPGGFTGRRRACSSLGGWRALLHGEVLVWASDGTRGWSVFLVDGGPGTSFSKRGTSDSLRRTYCGRSLCLLSQASSRKLTKEKVRRLAAKEATGMNGCQGTPWNEELNGKELQRLGGE